MNVIYFASSKGLGLTAHLTEYSIELNRLGINVVVIYDVYPFIDSLVHKLNENKTINISIKNLDELNPIYVIKNIFKIANLINEYEIDIIQCQGVLNLFLSYISKILSKKRPKIALYYHSFPAKYNSLPPKSRFLFPLMIKTINKMSDLILPVSKQTRTFLVNSGADPEKTFIVYNSLNFDLIHSFQKIDHLNDIDHIHQGLFQKKYVVYAAQLEEHKGHEILLKAFKKVLNNYNDVYLVLIGNGSNKDHLINLSRDMNIEKNVIFTGKLEYELTINIMSGASIAVVPSYKETFCHALIEPMSLGVPVITTKVGIAEEIIINGETGYIVPHEISKISEKIIFLLKNPDIKERIAKKGKRTVEDKFNIIKVSEELIDIYSSVL